MKSALKVRVYALEDFRYVSDISDQIDKYAEDLKKPYDRQWKQHCLTMIRQLVALYEGHIGRKVFNKF